MKYIISILLLTLVPKFLCTLKTQQLPVFSQYTFNSFLLNPATAGSEGYTTINLTSRRQWIGIEGAPSTDAISIQTRLYKRSFIQPHSSVKRRYIKLPRSGRIGMGGFIFCDRAGIFYRAGGQFTYAYHILKSKSQLSFGLTTGLYQFQINTTNLHLEENNDNLLDNNNLNITYADFNLGIYYKSPDYFAGLSLENLSQSSLSIGKYKGKFRILRQYNAIMGRQIEINSYLILEPSFFIKGSFHSLPQMEGAIKISIKDRIWIGISYRTSNSIIGIAGFKFEKLFVGYAYDYYIKLFTNSTNATHEIMIALKLGDNTRRYKWIERY